MAATALTFEHAEDVLERLLSWQDTGEETALVFITGTQGGAVRAPGALLAVSAQQSAGYISGGCIDADVVLQARQAIKSNETKALRYGAGSPFVDLPLPCGGAIEVLIVPFPDRQVLETALKRLRHRQPVTLSVSETDVELAIETTPHMSSGSHAFTYYPKLRLRIAGRGADAIALANMSSAAGYDTRVQLLDEDDIKTAERAGLRKIDRLETPTDLPEVDDDAWTAFVLLFHDPSWETALLQQALSGSAFYVGAVGSQRTHERRCEALRAAGTAEQDIDRIYGPIGLVPSLRDASMLAVSTLAEIIDLFPGKASAKRSNTAFILLAAGASARFEDGDKLMALLDGRPVLEHAAVLPGIDPQDLRLAVVREGDDSRANLLEGLGWTVLRNRDAALGQSTSLKRAMAQIIERSGIDQVVIILGDMPNVPQSHLSDMLEMAKRPSVSAVMSRSATRSSPPALFKRVHFESLLNVTGDQGAKKVFESVTTGAVTRPIDEHAAQDVDTLADLMRMRESALA